MSTHGSASPSEEDVIDVEVDIGDLSTASSSQTITSMETSATQMLMVYSSKPIDLREVDENKENWDPSTLPVIPMRTISPPQSHASAGSTVTGTTETTLNLTQSQSQSQVSTSDQETKMEVEETEHEAEETESEEDGQEDRVSRKEKSLGLLCQRFLLAMKAETEMSQSKTVHLESVARKMNVEKRRIYDIVNVMEALEAMSKTNKSFYNWHGLQDLPKLMADLQKEATEEHLPERILRVEHAMCSFTELGSGARDTVGSFLSVADITPIIPPITPNQKSDAENQMGQEKKFKSVLRDRNTRNSLAQLCRRFLMVLLCNPKTARKVSLDVASTVLIKDPETEGFEPPSRSRCRRLYDIANVLVAMGLIKKVHYLFGTKKIPLFVYSGPEPDENGIFDESICFNQQPLLSPVSCPQTPLQYRGIQGNLGGKRSQSEMNLAGNSNKFPRFQTDIGMSSMMQLAEIAERERRRIEKEQRTALAKPQAQKLTSLGQTLTPPLPNYWPGSPVNKTSLLFSQFSPISPLATMNSNGASPAQNKTQPNFQPIVLPKNPTWMTATQNAQFLRNLTIAQRAQHSVVYTRPSTSVPENQTVTELHRQATTFSKHSVSSILGVQQDSPRKLTEKALEDVKKKLDHLDTSPFQIVRRKPIDGCAGTKSPAKSVK
ncbi:unnamed protein product, partial [Mesorhabditis belari]|uniref:E2F/DP family winged-helix DNA-binding domain-containing protein n=1 Tax=Mesorhabditis belari TaxID=2138241 RepID=A0AAF3EYH1_9BILA